MANKKANRPAPKFQYAWGVINNTRWNNDNHPIIIEIATGNWMPGTTNFNNATAAITDLMGNGKTTYLKGAFANDAAGYTTTTATKRIPAKFNNQLTAVFNKTF